MRMWFLVATCVVLLGLAAWIVIYIFYIALRVGLGTLADRRNKKSYPDQQTRLGRVNYEHPHWTMLRAFEDGELRIYIDDADGQPDPKLVSFLTQHWGKLGQFAMAARNAVSELQEHHRLETVGSPVQGDVCLGFTHDKADCAETVFVDMSGLEVVGCVFAD